MWPAETFFLLMQRMSHFFAKMWPAYETEFETPVLDGQDRFFSFEKYLLRLTKIESSDRA
jgi:hypothetical protein